MTELRPILARLGLIQYLEAFEAEGFDTWETLCDITESDLTELEVKLGHRRKLQREIAISRGLSPKHGLSIHPTLTNEDGSCGDEDKGDGSKMGSHRADGSRVKRKYRRHPKPDENAPDRAPSAYVIFSNKVREDVKSQNLSFSEIAKRVGEEWQQLSAANKASYEAQASAAKEKYRADLHEYMKTDSYREYNEYLADFKQKNPSSHTGDKRPRFEKELSTHSSHSAGSREDSNNVDSKSTKISLDRRRADSFGSTATYSSTSGHPSPTVASIGKPHLPNLQGPPQLRPPSPTSGLPPTFVGRRDPAMPYLQSPSQLHIVADVSGHGLPMRSAALDVKERRLSSTSLAGLLQDSDMLRNRGSGSQSTTMQKVHQESSKSPNSSPTSSTVSPNATTASSQHTSLTSDQRSRRALPPPFPAGFKPLENQTPFASGISPPSAQPAPYLRPSFSSLTSSGNGHGSTISKPTPSQLPPIGHPPPQLQANQTSRSKSPTLGNPKLMDLDPSQPSFKGEYEEDAFLAPDADPLSVLAYAGRMVDRASVRSHEGPVTSSKTAAISELGRRSG